MSGPFGATPWMYDESAFYPLTIDQSLKFNDDESQYLSWTPAAAGNRKTWTWSGWVKRGNLDTLQGLFHCYDGASSRRSAIVFNANNTIGLDQGGSGSSGLIDTVAVFRDTSAWYHIVVAADYSNGTANDRAKIYVNGVLQSVSTSDDFDNADGLINSTNAHELGSFDGSGQFLDSYLSDIHFIDGQALDATYFGEFKEGIWIPKVYNGTYGTNGFHLEFKNDDTVEGFNAVTYRGTGQQQSVSGLGLEADLLWIKKRNSAENHGLFDSIRGANGRLQSDSTDAESTTGGQLTSFDSDGFTLSSTAPNQFNQSGHTFVAWAWDAGSGSAASNTDGSITSTVKANPDYGFSITSFVGNGTVNATTGHGLSSTPEMVLVKNRSTTVGWLAWHKDLSGATYRMDLNGSGAEYNDGNGALQGVSSSLLTLGSLNAVNQNSANMIAYCFHSVAGYSSIGSYSGTGAAGNTITTGFRPAFVMFKNANDAGASWYIHDATRDPYSPSKRILFPDGSDAEFNDTGNAGVTFTATGFTVDTTRNEVNGSGDTIIYMAFADTRDAAFWRDTSGNNNNWTPVNLDYRDSLPDSTTNNFAVFNPLMRRQNVSTLPTFSEGNLKAVYPDAGGNVTYAAGTVPITSGKWYYEAKIDSLTSNNVVVGWATEDEINEVTSSHVFIYSATGAIYIDGSLQSTEGALSVGDIIGTTIDLDNGYVGFYKNGVALSFSPSISITSANWWNSGKFLFAFNRGSTSDGTSANFGQDSTFAGATTAGGNTDDNGIGDFKYPVPSGYLALCSQNLPEPTIVDGSEHFNTVAYTGTGTTNAITVGFAPDWTWIKKRNTSRDHQLLDIVRGYTNNILYTNLTNAEDVGGTARIDSRDADGFTVSGPDQVNGNGDTFAAWNWKAGGTAVSNTDGSIASQVSANVDAGFSIVSWTGTGSAATIGHSLGVQPSMIIVKNRIDARNWSVWHKDLSSNDHYLRLDSTDAQASAGANYWNSTAPTSSVFSVGVEGDVNDSGDAMIAYCFANTKDYLKAGSYTGNGSSDGTFVYTGFRPAWVMLKRTDSANAWFVFDNQRDPYNFNVRYLNPNSSSAEAVGTNGYNDFLSNGFKIRASGTFANASGGTYIYLAFAENPFKYSNAR